MSTRRSAAGASTPAPTRFTQPRGRPSAPSRRSCPMSKYDVGYKRPPVHTRFTKGKSGNPSGRPKRRITQPTVLLEFERILGRRMRVNQNGRLQDISTLQAFLTQMVHKGIKGHTPTMALSLSLLFKVLATAEPEAGEVGRTGAEALAEIEAIFNEIASN